MDNQKICCESGKVRVSYKIPQRTYCREAYDIVIRYSSTFSDDVFPPSLRGVSQTVDIEYPATVISPFKINFYDEITDEIVGENYYSRAERGTIYIKAKSLDIPFDPYPNYFSGGNFLINNSWEVIATRSDGTSPELDLAQCGSFGNYTGCSYPDRWEYRDIELPIVYDLRGWKDAIDWVVDQISKEVPLAKLLKYLLFQRGCVIAVPNDNKVDIIFVLETLVPITLSINPFPSLEYILINEEFWAPSPAPPLFIFSIESPAGCPPPLVKLECCPETGCEECPPGTCEVQCGNFICCYDKNGKAVKTISK